MSDKKEIAYTLNQINEALEGIDPKVQAEFLGKLAALGEDAHTAEEVIKIQRSMAGYVETFDWWSVETMEPDEVTWAAERLFYDYDPDVLKNPAIHEAVSAICLVHKISMDCWVDFDDYEYIKPLYEKSKLSEQQILELIRAGVQRSSPDTEWVQHFSKDNMSDPIDVMEFSSVIHGGIVVDVVRPSVAVLKGYLKTAGIEFGGSD